MKLKLVTLVGSARSEQEHHKIDPPTDLMCRLAKFEIFSLFLSH